MLKSRHHYHYKIRRGYSAFVRGVLRPGEWCWLIDKKMLVTGDGVAPFIEGKYHGGLITFFVEFKKPSPMAAMPMLPPTIPRSVLDALVLEEGEVAYCPEDDWLYVGDGKSAGGIKAS